MTPERSLPDCFSRLCDSRAGRLISTAQERWSLISFIVAGAAATGTVVYYLVDAKSTASGSHSQPVVKRAQLVPVLSPQFQGVGVFGAF